MWLILGAGSGKSGSGGESDGNGGGGSDGGGGGGGGWYWQWYFWYCQGCLVVFGVICGGLFLVMVGVIGLYFLLCLCGCFSVVGVSGGWCYLQNNLFIFKFLHLPSIIVFVC